MAKSTNDLVILCACLRNTFPVLKHLPDDYIADDIKNAEKTAAKFVGMIRAEIELKFLPDPVLKTQNVLIQQGTLALRYVKEQISEWDYVRPSSKTICEHLDLIQSRFDSDWPGYRQAGHRFNYRQYQLV